MFAMRAMPLSAVRFAVGAQLLCAAYLQFIEWVPVFPWNDLSHVRRPDSGRRTLAGTCGGRALGFSPDPTQGSEERRSMSSANIP